MNRLVNRASRSFPWFDDIGRNLCLNDPVFNGLGDFFTDIKFPKYNVLKDDNDDLKLEVALAGYDKKDLSIELSADNILTLSSSTVTEESTDEVNNRYLKRGIAARNFTISWNIGTTYEVGDITYENGMLNISLNAKVPEKPKMKLLKIT